MNGNVMIRHAVLAGEGKRAGFCIVEERRGYFVEECSVDHGISAGGGDRGWCGGRLRVGWLKPAGYGHRELFVSHVLVINIHVWA